MAVIRAQLKEKSEPSVEFTRITMKLLVIRIHRFFSIPSKLWKVGYFIKNIDIKMRR